MAVSKRIRYEVLRRDNHTCRYCHAVDTPLTVDHVTPIALGGSDEPRNLVACCRDCNAGKAAASADETIVMDVQEDALRWAAAMKAALEQQSLKITNYRSYQEQFTKIWGNWTNRDEPLPLPDSWRNSLDHWNDLGVTEQMIEFAVTKAMERSGIINGQVFKYAAGIIWRMLDEAQTQATQAING